MQIIVVSHHLKAAKTLDIMPWHLAVAALSFVVLVLLTSATFSWLSVELRLPLVRDLMTSLLRQETQKTEQVVSNNLNMMASRIGELQAQLLHLDSLGDRLANLAGLKRDADKAKTAPAVANGGQGGPLIAAPLTVTQLQKEIDLLTRQVEIKTDELAMLESRFLEKRVRERLLPTTLPVKGAVMGSGFGVRADPIAGTRAIHEGIDLTIASGTPVVAAAAGVVVAADYHGEFGNMVDIDHGDGLTSRYAHMSRMDVKAGQMVRRGQRIGAVGSTGRSTGPHLHFEVRMLGVPQNPAVFLRQGPEYAGLASR